MRLSKKQVIDRMQQGEPLRWISDEITGLSKRSRHLFLGRDQLDRDTAFMVIGMEIDGVLRETTPYHPDADFIDYELVQPA